MAPPTALPVPELIEGVRVRLRRSTVDDAEALQAVVGDAQVMRYLEWPASADRDETWQFLAGVAGRWSAGQEHHWAVVAKADGAVIGSIAARVRGHAADFGVMVGRDHWGRGLGREAAGLLVGWLLRQRGIERVWAAPDAADVRSRRMLEQLSFTCEGVLRRATARPAFGGAPRDAAMYARVADGQVPAPEPAPVAPITAANPTVAEMEARVARFAALVPTDDYLDARLPGCDRTTWRVLGMPGHAPLAAGGFHLNLVRCAPGRSAPLHNHLTPELFMPLTGQWEVFWGPMGERALRLGPWDTLVVPPGVSRGFRNVGADDAMLLGIAEGHEPGRISWPEAVRAVARAAGVELPTD